MEILITGATGFIGGALKKSLLIKSGVEILEFNSSDGDISDISLFEKFKDKNVKHVVHLAANTFVPSSWDSPTDFIQTNTLGTQNVLEFCRKKAANLTFVSAYLYGAPEKLPIQETDKIEPNNPYALSKHLAEQLCQFYSNYYEINVSIIRPFNVYGSGQSEIFLIPSILRQIQSDASTTIGVKVLEPKRDYIFVDDLIELIQKSIFKKNDSSDSFNIFNAGFGKSYSVEEVIEIAKEVTDSNKLISASGQIRINEIMDTVADISKAEKHLGWVPKTTLKEGIRIIVNQKKGHI